VNASLRDSPPGHVGIYVVTPRGPHNPKERVFGVKEKGEQLVAVPNMT
jgi:hypothetical protein